MFKLFHVIISCVSEGNFDLALEWQSLPLTMKTTK